MDVKQHSTNDCAFFTTDRPVLQYNELFLTEKTDLICSVFSTWRPELLRSQRETETERERDRDRQTDRNRETETDRETDRQTDTEREIGF